MTWCQGIVINVFLNFLEIYRLCFHSALLQLFVQSAMIVLLNWIHIQSNVQKWTTKGIRCLLVFWHISMNIYMYAKAYPQINSTIPTILILLYLLIQLHENTFYCTFMFDIFIMDSCLCYTVSSSLMSECLTSHKYTSGTSLAIWLAERILRLKRLYWLV